MCYAVHICSYVNLLVLEKRNTDFDQNKIKDIWHWLNIRKILPNFSNSQRLSAPRILFLVSTFAKFGIGIVVGRNWRPVEAKMRTLKRYYWHKDDADGKFIALVETKWITVHTPERHSRVPEVKAETVTRWVNACWHS